MKPEINKSIFIDIWGDFIDCFNKGEGLCAFARINTVSEGQWLSVNDGKSDYISGCSQWWRAHYCVGLLRFLKLCLSWNIISEIKGDYINKHYCFFLYFFVVMLYISVSYQPTFAFKFIFTAIQHCCTLSELPWL